MENLKVVKIDQESIEFDNGAILTSDHQSDCCESHYLSMEHLTMDDFNGLLFNLSNDNFFVRVPEFGIKLLPTNGHPVSIPGYGSNNGYYSSNLDLVIQINGREYKSFDISDCQVIEG